jgi:hypothetical protein
VSRLRPRASARQGSEEKVSSGRNLDQREAGSSIWTFCLFCFISRKSFTHFVPRTFWVICLDLYRFLPKVYPPLLWRAVFGNSKHHIITKAPQLNALRCHFVDSTGPRPENGIFDERDLRFAPTGEKDSYHFGIPLMRVKGYPYTQRKQRLREVKRPSTLYPLQVLYEKSFRLSFPDTPSGTDISRNFIYISN